MLCKKIYLKHEDTEINKVKMYQAKSNHWKAGVSLLISNKRHF